MFNVHIVFYGITLCATVTTVRENLRKVDANKLDIFQ